MFAARHVGALAVGWLALATLPAVGQPAERIDLSLKQFTALALKSSLRSLTAEENLTSSRYSWQARRRGLTWPTLAAAAARGKTFSDNDLGNETDGTNKSASVTLKQPLLTGADLSLSSSWTESDSETTSSGTVVTRSLSKTAPKLSASFKQPLFVFSGNTALRSRREANLSWENDQDGYWKERLDIEFSARTLYYDLLLQNEIVQVERKKAESARLVNETTRALVRAGKLPEVEMIRADINARTDERRIQNAESDLEKAFNRARDLISFPNDQPIGLTSKLGYEPFRVSLERLSRAAAEKNPSVLTAARNVELARLQDKETREKDNPQLSTSGTYEKTMDRSDEDLPVDPYSWTVGVGVEWALYDADQTRLEVKKSQIALKNAQRNYENTVRNVQVDLQNAVLEIKRVEEQIADFGPQKENAERNVRAIRLQYRNGLTRLTDVFDAENQLRDLELENLRLLVAYNTARDRVKLLVGTDVSDLERRTP